MSGYVLSCSDATNCIAVQFYQSLTHAIISAVDERKQVKEREALSITMSVTFCLALCCRSLGQWKIAGNKNYTLSAKLQVDSSSYAIRIVATSFMLSQNCVEDSAPIIVSIHSPSIHP